MNVHTCHACLWETKTPDHVIAVFHPCQSSGRRERLTFDRPDREEETQAWARTLLGAELAEAVEHRDGEDVLLRGEGDQ